MKKLLFLMLLISVTIFSADIKIPVQGYLTDANGVALNGEQNIKFSLYNIDENGSSIWTNQDFVEINVENGEFSYMLGTTDFIDSSILENSTPLYLEVEINDEVLSPRIELGVEAKSAYAYKSELANNALNSEKLEGKTLTEVKTTVKSEVKTEIDNEKLNAILSRLDALETAKTSLETKVTALETANAEKDTKIANLETRVTTLETNVSSLTTLVNSLKTKLDFITVTQAINLDNLKTTVSNNSTNIATNTHDLNDSDGRLQYFINLLSARIAAIEAKTNDMSIVNLTYKGVNYKTVRFSHVNVQIVNGSGATNRESNGLIVGTGLGNLIVGYNEEADSPNLNPSNRTGYHNLIVGSSNNYTSFGSVVFGRFNKVNSMFGTVTGGMDNKVTTPYSSISGGTDKITPTNNNWYYWIGDQYHSN